jgi:hypothetical protein
VADGSDATPSCNPRCPRVPMTTKMRATQQYMKKDVLGGNEGGRGVADPSQPAALDNQKLRVAKTENKKPHLVAIGHCRAHVHVVTHAVPIRVATIQAAVGCDLQSTV